MCFLAWDDKNKTSNITINRWIYMISLAGTTGSFKLSQSLTWQQSTAPTGSRRLPGRLQHPCFLQPTSVNIKSAKRKSDVFHLSRHGIQAGRILAAVVKLVDSGFSTIKTPRLSHDGQAVRRALPTPAPRRFRGWKNMFVVPIYGQRISPVAHIHYR